MTHPDDHDDSLGGTQGHDTADPYTLLPILVAGAKVVYVVLCVIALALFTLMLFSPNAEAGHPSPNPSQNRSIYYVDASFSGCDAMGIAACVPRTETYMHTLAALAGVPIQTDSLSGARMADFLDAFEGRLDWWAQGTGRLSPPTDVIVGLTNDAWAPHERQRIVDGVQYLSDTLARLAPGTTLWVVDYPEYAGLVRSGQTWRMPDPKQYEADRRWYRDWASRLPNANVIPGVWDGWVGSLIEHPSIGPDYHPGSRTAMLAAMRMMEAVLSQ